MGDKTQLLALVLAARFHRPVPIVLGILVATIANHSLAGLAGGWIVHALGPDALRWVVGLSFLGDAVAKKVSWKLVHGTAAAIFAALGALTLLNVGKFF